MAFAHLHVHSQFTLLNGVNTPKELAKAAKDRGMSALALTDGCNLYGAVELTKAAKEYGLNPLIGAELWVDPRGIGCREGKLEFGQADPHAFQVVLIAEDQGEGYRNLCALITRAIFDGLFYRPRVDLSLLERHSGGLFCLTGTELGAIRRGALEQSRGRVQRLGEIFGADRLFCELSDQGLPWQPGWCGEVRGLARELGLSCVVTNDVRYVDPKDVVVLEALNAVALGAALDDRNRPRHRTDQQYLKSEAELRAIFPEDGEAIDRAAQIAERCHFKFRSNHYYFPASKPPDPAPDADTDDNWRFFFEAFPPSKEFRVPEARPEGAGSLNGYFRWYARAGLERRLERIKADQHATYWERLEAELTMIIKMGFAAYLLIVAEFINWSKDRGIPVGPGRGSAAGSLVAWAMRITDIDPLRFALLFERFLNPERVSMPDIDVDFAQDRREEVIAHVREKYGAPLVSQIITFGKLQAKAAIRDIARTLELTFQEADRIAKLIPNQLNITIADALEQEPKLKELCRADPRVQRVVSMARQIEGITRQTGVHAAGVVIADQPLEQLAPLYRDSPEGGPVVQYDMKSAESIGLIKFDFLGLKTLDQIRDAVAMVERNTGATIDMSLIADDAKDAYAMLQKGDALGVFQVESSGMRELLTRLRPTCLDDLVALVALYRPGPLSSGMVDDFIDRKWGRKEVTYAFPELEQILNTTYGTIVYQEQVMQVAQVLAGYSLGEADLLRRAMGKKDANEMAKQKGRFTGGAVKRGHEEQKAADLFDLLAKFAEYGFNKCLHGDTVITDADTGEATTVVELFRAQQAMRVLAVGADGRLTARRVTAAVWNGRKPVYRLRTERGRSIVATGNHRFRGPGGWRMLAELEPGDRLAAPAPGGKGGVPAATVAVEVEEARRRLGWSWQELERRWGHGTRGLHGGRARRHDLPRETVAGLAEVLGSAELRWLAAAEVSWDRVLEIVPEGVADTYDLTVEEDHNFVADGLIVHNSHSAAYGYVSYQTAWMKAHHRGEHMASMMTMDAGDTDKLVVYMGDCRKAGLKILPPDLNRSLAGFEAQREDRRSIRYGFCGIKGLGDAAIESILEARTKGTFADLLDFLQRLDTRKVNRKVLEVLIKSGAMDGFGVARARLLASLDDAMAAAAAEAERRASGQMGLFGAATKPQLKMAEVVEWPLAERLRYEKEALGLFLSGHPVEEYLPDADRMRVTASDRLATAASEKDVALLGMISTLKVIKTKKGDKMAFAQLEDLAGSVEAVFFPEAFSRAQHTLATDQPVVVRGKLERKEDGIKILADAAEPAEAVRERTASRVCLRLPISSISKERVDRLKELLPKHAGKCELRLVVEEVGRFRAPLRVPEALRVAATRSLKNELRALFNDDAEVRFE